MIGPGSDKKRMLKGGTKDNVGGALQVDGDDLLVASLGQLFFTPNTKWFKFFRQKSQMSHFGLFLRISEITAIYCAIMKNFRLGFSPSFF